MKNTKRVNKKLTLNTSTIRNLTSNELQVGHGAKGTIGRFSDECWETQYCSVVDCNDTIWTECWCKAL